MVFFILHFKTTLLEVGFFNNTLLEVLFKYFIPSEDNPTSIDQSLFLSSFICPRTFCCRNGYTTFKVYGLISVL